MINRENVRENVVGKIKTNLPGVELHHGGDLTCWEEIRRMMKPTESSLDVTMSS